MATITQAVKNFLVLYTHADLAGLYNHDMEVQVNVAQDLGTLRKRKAGYSGRSWNEFVDLETGESWKPLRVPYKAKSIPEFTDKNLWFDLKRHAEGIGMTGWDWVAKCSKWVAFDFDGIIGHSEQSNRLSQLELREIEKIAFDIPWVSIRKSTSGSGLHFYVFLDNVPTTNHTEHAALARALLGKLSLETGYDFTVKVDVCGGNHWVWHRKMTKENQGLLLLKQGTKLLDIPPNWKDHLDVVKGKRRVNLPSFIKDTEESGFDQLTAQRPRIKLTEDHIKVIKYLEKIGASSWWDNDRRLLVSHTYDLKKAHTDLQLKGLFDTVATGKDVGNDWNNFGVPLPDGSWVIRRYTKGINEAVNWDQDPSGYTRCYLNREPTLQALSRTYGGVEGEKGDFSFKNASTAAKGLERLNVKLDLPEWATQRELLVKPLKDGRVSVSMKRETTDRYDDVSSWREERGRWKKIYNVQKLELDELDTINYDQLVRHLITLNGDDAGWMVSSGEAWHHEPLSHVKIVLKSCNLKETEINRILGQCVLEGWTIVNEPFQSEFLSNRRWNRGAAQYRYLPQQDEPFNHPTWDKILSHVGSGFDTVIQKNAWCLANGIESGGDYLRVWVASLFQNPKKLLPYLFFYSKEEGTGKSTFHEAISLLMTDSGYVRADTALMSPSAFNGELEKAVLCIIQETDLSKSGQAKNRLKDWITSPQISIHVKGLTPYMIPNTTHYVQTANDHNECPVFPGDSRIMMGYVHPINPLDMIPRDLLFKNLEQEAAAFMGTILRLEMPLCTEKGARGQFGVPVLETAEKHYSASTKKGDLELFLEETTFEAPGEKILYSDLWAKFQEWLDPSDLHTWSKIKLGRKLPPEFPKGRATDKNNVFYVGNLSYTKPTNKNKTRYCVKDGNLVMEDKV